MAMTHELKQQLFNEAYIGVMKQGALGISQTNDCQYGEFENSRHCGIGHILANRGLVPPGIDAKGRSLGINCAIDCANGGVTQFSLLLLTALTEIGAEDEDDLNFLAELQNTHDATSNFNEFKSNMEAFACSYSFTVPEV